MRANDHIIITGHRGAAGLAPENTLASIQLALDLGVDRIEIDIQQTKDNVLIVLHDRSLRRTTNGFGYVKQKKYNVLLNYSAGVKFSRHYESERIPTLEQVIDLIDGRAELLIETKFSYLYYPLSLIHI